MKKTRFETIKYFFFIINIYSMVCCFACLCARIMGRYCTGGPSDCGAEPRPAWAWRAAAHGLLAAVLLCGGCSGGGESTGPAGPPGRFFGLAFGDPPGPGLARLAVPLPSSLAESLAFYAAPGQEDAPFGAAITQATLAFWQGGLFSVEAALAAPADASTLAARLTRDLGPPHCREAASGRVCLWRAGDFEAVLDQSDDAARLMLRQAATAAAVAAALPQPPPLERAE